MKYRLFIILLLMSATLTTHAQKKYDAVFKNISKSYVLHKDGSLDYTYHKELLLNSQRAFDKMYGETFIVYNPEYQTLTINQAYTIRQDGSRVNTPANAFNEVLPSPCTNCARYNNMKEMVVTHTALEYGATIVLDYTIRQKAGVLSDMSEIFVLAESSPVEKYNVTITVPENKTDCFKSSSTSAATRTCKDGYQTFTWTFENLRQTSAEPFLPPATELYPHICFSSADNETLLENILRQPAFTLANLPECDLVLSQITSADNDSHRNALAIRDWVVDHVHYNALSFKHNGYHVASADKVWNSNCGNEAEKAVLLATLLRQAGYDTRIGVMVRSQLKDVSVAAISRWAVVTQNDTDSTTLILSPISKNQTSLTSLHPDEQLILLTQDSKHEVLFAQHNNHLTLSGNIILQPEGKADGSLSVTLGNNNLPTFNMLDPSDRQPFNTFLKNVKVETAETRLLEKMSGWHIDYTIKDCPKTDLGQGYYAIGLPEDRFTETTAANRLTTRRREPLACKPVSVRYDLTVTLPAEGYRIVNKTEHHSQKFAFGQVDIHMTVNPNGTVTISRQLVIKSERITTSQYADFRKMMILWDDETYRRIVFKKSGE